MKWSWGFPESFLYNAQALLGIIHLARKQNVPKSKHFLSFDRHTNVCLSGVRNLSFMENTAYVLNEWSLCGRLANGYSLDFGNWIKVVYLKYKPDSTLEKSGRFDPATSPFLFFFQNWCRSLYFSKTPCVRESWRYQRKLCQFVYSCVTCVFTFASSQILFWKMFFKRAVLKLHDEDL